MPHEPAHDVTHRTFRWTIVFIANCLVPGWLGILFCYRSGGLIGMALGVFFLWLFSLFLVKCSCFIYRSLDLGGGVLALTQFLPVLQILAGVLALQFWYMLCPLPPDPASIRAIYSHLSDDPILAEVGGFVVSVLAGQSLLTLAFIIGVRRWPEPLLTEVRS
ncbi:hypothetical protein BH11PLA2_BH11PLA2_48600 [soil metagenome]